MGQNCPLTVYRRIRARAFLICRKWDTLSVMGHSVSGGTFCQWWDILSVVGHSVSGGTFCQWWDILSVVGHFAFMGLAFCPIELFNPVPVWTECTLQFVEIETHSQFETDTAIFADSLILPLMAMNCHFGTDTAIFADFADFATNDNGLSLRGLIGNGLSLRGLLATCCH